MINCLWKIECNKDGWMNRKNGIFCKKLAFLNPKNVLWMQIFFFLPKSKVLKLFGGQLALTSLSAKWNAKSAEKVN